MSSDSRGDGGEVSDFSTSHGRAVGRSKSGALIPAGNRQRLPSTKRDSGGRELIAPVLGHEPQSAEAVTQAERTRQDGGANEHLDAAVPNRNSQEVSEWVAERQMSGQLLHGKPVELYFIRTKGSGMAKVNVAQIKDWETAVFIVNLREETRRLRETCHIWESDCAKAETRNAELLDQIGLLGDRIAALEATLTDSIAANGQLDEDLMAAEATADEWHERWLRLSNG